MMTATSAWFLNIKSKLKSPDLTAVFEQHAAGYSLKVHIVDDSCWLIVSWSRNSRTAFRLVYSPNDDIRLKEVSGKNEHITFRIATMYYYPTMLPKEMLKEKPKTGEVDPNLWIALEDLHDGWEQSGEVGQEVYGAGNAFGILPRHYMRVEGQCFMIYTDYPTYGFSPKKDSPAKFKLAGDPRLSCRLQLVKTGEGQLPHFNVSVNGGKVSLAATVTKEGHLEFSVAGNSEIKVQWK